MDKKIEAKIYLGKDTRGEIIYTLANGEIFEGDSTRGNDEIDLLQFRIPRNLEINNKTGLVFIPGGVFGTQQNFLKFDQNKNYFYTGQSGVFANSIDIKFTIDYERGSETLKIGEDDEMIKSLSFILDKKLDQLNLMSKAANDNNPENLRKAA
jgi:hypothetical protein